MLTIPSGLRISTGKEYKECGQQCNYNTQARNLETSSTAMAAPPALQLPETTRQDAYSLLLVAGVGYCFQTLHIQWLHFLKDGKTFRIK